MTSSGWLTLAETAKALNVSDRTIRRWLRRGKIHGELRAGPHGPQYYFPIAHVRALQEPAVARALEEQHGLEERLSKSLARSLRDQLIEELHAVLHEALMNSRDELRRELGRIQVELTQFRKELQVVLEDRQS